MREHDAVALFEILDLCARACRSARDLVPHGFAGWSELHEVGAAKPRRSTAISASESEMEGVGARKERLRKYFCRGWPS